MSSLHDPTHRIGQMVTLVEEGRARPARIVSAGAAGVLLDLDGQHRLIPSSDMTSIQVEDPA